MQCELKNPCTLHKHWCCHFCALKCPDRCHDDHKDCQWFNDIPLEESCEDGTEMRFFKYVERKNGTFVKKYLTGQELADWLAKCQENTKKG